MKKLAITFGLFLMLIVSPLILFGFIVSVLVQGVVYGWNIAGSMFETLWEELCRGNQ